MIIKHIGADGRVHRTFENVSSIHQHQGSSVVSVNRRHIDLPPRGYTGVGFSSWAYNYELPLALINLAPGESVERVEDDPIKS